MGSEKRAYFPPLGKIEGVKNSVSMENNLFQKELDM